MAVTKLLGKAASRSVTKSPKFMGMVEEVTPLRLGSTAAKKKGTSTAALAATAGVGAAAMADGMPKKGTPTAEAKGRRGGNIGTLPVAPKSSKKSIAEESDEEYRKIEADRIDRGLGPRSKEAKPSPKAKVLGGREVKNGKVFVSKEELDAFKKKYGADKTLRDLLNKERNLTRREDKSKLKPLKSVAEDRKALDEKAAKKKAREEEVKKMVKAAGLAKGGMAKKK